LGILRSPFFCYSYRHLTWPNLSINLFPFAPFLQFFPPVRCTSNLGTQIQLFSFFVVLRPPRRPPLCTPPFSGPSERAPSPLATSHVRLSFSRLRSFGPNIPTPLRAFFSARIPDFQLFYLNSPFFWPEPGVYLVCPEVPRPQ